MEKIFRYAFFIFAIAFSTFLLSPSDARRSSPKGFYSLTDSTTAAKILIDHHKGAKRWEEAHHLKNECRYWNRHCNTHPFEYGTFEKIIDLSAQFSWDSPEYQSAEDKFLREWNLQNSKTLSKTMPEMLQIQKIGKPLYENYLDSQREYLKYSILAANLLVLFFSALLIALRTTLAKFLCKILGISVNLAKKAHNNV